MGYDCRQSDYTAGFEAARRQKLLKKGVFYKRSLVLIPLVLASFFQSYNKQLKTVDNNLFSYFVSLVHGVREHIIHMQYAKLVALD